MQQALRHWFERWGRPRYLHLDHGAPWGVGKRDLPSLFELWLVGLDVDILWSRRHCPQDNGKVERSHRTTQAWSAPRYCRDVQQLQRSLDQAVCLQRTHYPTRSGSTRLQRYPDLTTPLRPYHRSQESHVWSLHRVYRHLEQGCWQRQVDESGRISLYNRRYAVGRRFARSKVWVRFVQGEWVCCDAKGTEIARLAALEINAETISQLQFARSRRR